MGSNIEVKSLTDEMLLEFKGLDEITTPDKVCNKLQGMDMSAAKKVSKT